MEHMANELEALKLPAFPRLEGDLASYVKTQVYQRAKILGIDEKSVFESARDLFSLYQRICSSISPPSSEISFRGKTFSKLNEFLKKKGRGTVIRIESGTLSLDEPLRISLSDCHIDFNCVKIETSGNLPQYCIYIEGSKNIAISGLSLPHVRSGIHITQSEGMMIRDCKFLSAAENPIVVVGQVKNFILLHNQFHETGRAAIVVDYDVQSGMIEDNVISGGKGHANFHAGILLTDKGIHRLGKMEKFPEKIFDRIKPPLKIIILHNTIMNGLSSGIYSDGGVLNYLLENRITGNSKEGICLDSGSTANIFYGNIVKNNGKRYGQTDQALKEDFVLGHGRLADGTAAAKLPGISIDNTVYNVILSNMIQDNYGCGVKMVRTGFRNIIALNIIRNNNEGASDKFHFFGIELGAAIPDVPTGDLDFLASPANIISQNMIVGDHYAGIFLGNGSIHNILSYNTILDPSHWAVESVREQPNKASQNITNARSLNINP